MTRSLWMVLGALCFVLGWVGLVLPMMPGFVFLLAAAFCFSRGNPAWERWMLDHPRLGPSLNDWRERRAVSRPAKRSALLAMALAAAIAWVLVGIPRALVTALVLVVVGAWLWTRPE